jgi:uncharacterized protein GlcG (DUF336 family)
MSLMLTLEVATTVKTAILRAAQGDEKRPVSIAIADDRGDLIAFDRMDGAPVRSAEIAINKAYTAARVGRDTILFREKVRREGNQISWFGDRRLTGLPGGVVLEVGGRVIGGIGVSGRAAEEDHELGRLGRTALG